MDELKIPTTFGSTNREELVLCRKHSCLITHDNTVRREQSYLQDKINAKHAAESGLELGEKSQKEYAKLIEKTKQKQAKEAATLAAAAAEQLRKSSLSKEELEAERVEKSRLARLKTAANKIAKELKEREKAKEYETAVASIAAKNALNAV